MERGVAIRVLGIHGLQHKGWKQAGQRPTPLPSAVVAVGCKEPCSGRQSNSYCKHRPCRAAPGLDKHPPPWPPQAASQCLHARWLLPCVELRDGNRQLVVSCLQCWARVQSRAAGCRLRPVRPWSSTASTPTPSLSAATTSSVSPYRALSMRKSISSCCSSLAMLAAAASAVSTRSARRCKHTHMIWLQPYEHLVFCTLPTHRYRLQRTRCRLQSSVSLSDVRALGQLD